MSEQSLTAPGCYLLMEIAKRCSTFDSCAHRPYPAASRTQTLSSHGPKPEVPEQKPQQVNKSHTQGDKRVVPEMRGGTGAMVFTPCQQPRLYIAASKEKAEIEDTDKLENINNNRNKLHSLA